MQYSHEIDEIVNTEFKEIRDKITNFIIEEIKTGTDTWQMPWHDNILPLNVYSKKYYLSSINIFLLLEQRYAKNFSTNIWGTEKQWKKKYSLNLGEKNCVAYKFKPYMVTDKKGVESVKFFYPSNLYHIFNSDQRKNFDLSDEFPESARKLDDVEFFIKQTGAVIHFRDYNPSYDLKSDIIVLRPRENFVRTEDSTATDNYYSTILHELIHWTGVSHRCNRNIEDNMGIKERAFEELVAELGASFLCSCLNVNIVPRKSNIDYIGNWLEILGNDEYALLNAADQAIEAIKFLSEISGIDLTKYNQMAENSN